MPKKEFYDQLAALKLGTQSAQTGLIGIVRGADHQLSSKFLSSPALKSQGRLGIHTVWTGSKAKRLAKFVLRQLLHSHDDSARRAGTSRPALYELVDLPPSSEVEIAHAEVCPGGQFQGFGESRE